MAYNLANVILYEHLLCVRYHAGFGKGRWNQIYTLNSQLGDKWSLEIVWIKKDSGVKHKENTGKWPGAK